MFCFQFQKNQNLESTTMKKILELTDLAKIQFEDFEKKIPEDDVDELSEFAVESEEFNKKCSKVIKRMSKLLEQGGNLHEKASNVLAPDESKFIEWDNQQLILCD